MTKKLYYEDVYLSTFEGTVVQAAQKDGAHHIALDQTAFYPEGGGQPSDTGTLGGLPVSHVYERDGLVWHVLPQGVQMGDRLAGAVDWVRRMHFMQQHLGQHILSALLVKHMDIQTVSVHFGLATSTLDTDKPLSNQMVERVEQLCGDMVYANLPVETLFPSTDEIERMSRKKIPDTGEPIRIVKIPDLDYTPCCGTHCGRTAEAGPIKIWKQESYKGGSRLTFSCGRATMERVRSIWNEVAALGGLLSVGELELVGRVTKLTEELSAQKKVTRRLLDQRADSLAERLLSQAESIGSLRLVCHVEQGAGQEDLKRLHSRLTALTAGENVVALLGGENGGEACLVFGCGKGVAGIDLRPALGESLPLIGGKGGGGPAFAQGKGTEPGGLKAAVAKATAAVKEQMETVR